MTVAIAVGVRHWFFWGLALLVGAAASAASGAFWPPRQQTTRDLAEVFIVPSGTKESPCKPGRWRVADSDTLRRHVLPLSHLLIRHEAVDSSDVPFSLLDWKSSAEPPRRSRAEAKALATSARQRLIAGESFEQVAREMSDDPVSRQNGGRLGVFPVSELAPWPNVVDCLDGLAPGETSQVVETSFGFHVLTLREPPKGAEEVALRRLVIGHRDAPFLGFVARPSRAGAFRDRSLDEASRLAHNLTAELSPQSFDALAKEHSEHVDAAFGGQLGQWKPTEPTTLPRLIEQLAQLKIGEIWGPVETELGLQFFLREQDRPRQAFAARLRHVAFDSDGERAALAVAERLSPRAPLENDGTFILESWLEGRGWPPLENALSLLSPGQVLEHPIQGPTGFIVGWRVQAPLAFQREAVWGVPTAMVREVDHLVVHLHGVELDQVLRQALNLVGRSHLSEQPQMQAQLASFEGRETPEDKLMIWRELLSWFRQSLGEQELSELEEALALTLDRSIFGEASP